MKKRQYYIPVTSNFKIDKGKVIPVFTLLKADNIEGIKECMPDKKIIVEHIIQQSILYRETKQFHPINIEVGEDLYNEIVRSINYKVKSKVPIESVDLVFDTKTLPIIQIVKKQPENKTV